MPVEDMPPMAWPRGPWRPYRAWSARHEGRGPRCSSTSAWRRAPPPGPDGIRHSRTSSQRRARDSSSDDGGRFVAWASEKDVCSTVWAATATPTTASGPRSRSASHQAAPPVANAPAAMAHQGTAVPDIRMWPRAASSTQTAAGHRGPYRARTPPCSHGGLILASGLP